jgi:hypothetical protein
MTELSKYNENQMSPAMLKPLLSVPLQACVPTPKLYQYAENTDFLSYFVTTNSNITLDCNLLGFGTPYFTWKLYCFG